jgi:hypothetical protein
MDFDGFIWLRMGGSDSCEHNNELFGSLNKDEFVD